MDTDKQPEPVIRTSAIPDNIPPTVSVPAPAPAVTVFFTPSDKKLIVMSLCTFGFYHLYWFYKNWTAIKNRSGEKIMPFWRSFFGVLWFPALCRRIKALAAERQVPDTIHTNWNAGLFFLAQLSSRLPGPFALLSFLSVLCLLPANRTLLNINRAENPAAKADDHFTAWNWVGIVLGGLLLAAAVAGSFLPDPVAPTPTFGSDL